MVRKERVREQAEPEVPQLFLAMCLKKAPHNQNLPKPEMLHNKLRIILALKVLKFHPVP
jgi:hypothetical protein